MKRFYLATPTRFEDRMIEELGALGSVQLISDYTVNGFKRVDTVEKCEKYLKLQQRIISIVSALPPEKKVTKRTLRGIFAGESHKPTAQPEPPRTAASLEQIEISIDEAERRLDERFGKLEKSRSDLKDLMSLNENLKVLQKHGLRTDQFGDFESIFVKAGYMNRALSTKLQTYFEATNVRFTKWPEKREEDFLVILGLNREWSYAEDTLTKLNFVPLTFPTDITPEPRDALRANEASTQKIGEEISQLENSIRTICTDFQQTAVTFDPLVRRALAIENARSTFSRTETLSLIHGWVSSTQERSITQTALTVTNGAAFLRFDEPRSDEHPPVQISNSGVSRWFELFTRLRGIPQYSELDPTLIVTILFPIMYGLMFGDIGQGLVLLAMGLVFSRFRKGFMGIPARAMGRLGGVLATCGASAMFFGILYGEFFLSEAFHPIFVNPIQGQTTMIILALLFGVAQLGLGISLKIVNLLRIREMIGAGFQAIRLLYYVTGVALAVKFATSMSFTVFSENLSLTVIAIVCLIVLFFSPTIEAALKHELKLGEDIMKGASEFIETFLSYLTNSISYVRLAAFAIAHAALGLSAVILAGMIGYVPGFLLMNFLALTIEALGVFIQCMRLTYYEFFTKFYSGNGTPYRPFSLPKILGTVK